MMLDYDFRELISEQSLSLQQAVLRTKKAQHLDNNSLSKFRVILVFSKHEEKLVFSDEKKT